ncbi:hypothetical protein SAMN04244567_03199 [Paracoccus pantotrophus]|nr:hypothetical protein SAMN04244567_03199 [Paracoccus pantotrophus]
MRLISPLSFQSLTFRHWTSEDSEAAVLNVSVMVRQNNILTSPLGTFNQEAYIAVSPSGALSHWVLPPGY